MQYPKVKLRCVHVSEVGATPSSRSRAKIMVTLNIIHCEQSIKCIKKRKCRVTEQLQIL